MPLACSNLGVQRLFSSFARGAPGVGLLLMRVVAGTTLLSRAAGALPSDTPLASIGLSLLILVSALLLLVGLWTPVGGVLAAIAAAWHGWSNPSGPSADILLGSLGIALALIGPGAWSVDARLFGWKRLDIQNGDSTVSTPSDAGDDSTPF